MPYKQTVQHYHQQQQQQQPPQNPQYPQQTFAPQPPSSIPRLNYGVAAAFVGKDQAWHATRSIFHFNPYHRIQPTKKPASQRPPSGHDAFFITPVGDTGSIAVGVADGVGGWVDSGVDPADFSHAFCDYMAMAAFGYPGPELITPKTLMQKGYDAVCNDKAISAGGSTAVVGVAQPNGSVEIANLGDSGYIHLRLGAVHAFSEAQQHGFNTPYQLSVVPPSMAARMATYGGAHLSDLPRNADVSRHEMRSGDVLVFASDGVWDNMFNEDILKIVSKMMMASGAWFAGPDGAMAVSPSIGELTKLPEPREGQILDSRSTLQSLVASRIALTAKSNSVEKRRDSPFAQAVRRARKGQQWLGGKVDDIMVVVLIASQDGSMTAVKPRL
ncbi:hypothetical protein TD95_003659 [Thielaviopsis punctulata]|uniref:Protein phosphatase n=1 Tax=Thielaviopsis punctulata TaxID=72032 RepID=A0A0F4ZJM2_9PEZI|nr:hypothetical protein TD95_003659 [Thielaviopsis punctulata]